MLGVACAKNCDEDALASLASAVNVRRNSAKSTTAWASDDEIFSGCKQWVLPAHKVAVCLVRYRVKAICRSNPSQEAVHTHASDGLCALPPDWGCCDIRGSGVYNLLALALP